MAIYLSGGIAGIPDYVERFAAGKDVLQRSGHKVLSPLDVTACEGGGCCVDPVGPVHNGHTWTCWLRHDLIAMLNCTAVATLPGWQKSAGARLEVTTAINVGMPTFSVDPWMFNHSMALRSELRVKK